MTASLVLGLQRVCTHDEFADLVGLSRSRVTQLVGDGVLENGRTASIWLRAYVERLREQAAGRDIDGTLANERAQLTRSQRIHQDMRNAILQGEYAPIGLLADILGIASAALAQRLEALPARIKTVCPELPDEARTAIEATLANARNEWVQATGELCEARLNAIAASEGEGQEDVDATANALTGNADSDTGERS